MEDTITKCDSPQQEKASSRGTRGILLAIALAACHFLPMPGWGREVTVALVAPGEGPAASLEEQQALWKCPFGGWVVTTWPFGLRVDDTVIFTYRTTEERLAMERDPDKPSTKGLDDLLGTGKPDKVRPEDLRAFRLDRKAAVTLQLAEGRHVIHPFGIQFTVAADGSLASRDERLRLKAKEGRVEVFCHPVVIKTFSGGRSVCRPLHLACGSTSLLDGLGKMTAEFESKDKSAPGPGARDAFQRLTLYLPASRAENAYEVNGVRFELDAEGHVQLAAHAKARCVDGREIQLLTTVERPPAMKPLGVGWFGASAPLTISCGPHSVAGRGASGSAWLPVPASGVRTIGLGKQTVRLPESDPQWPHQLLIRDVANAACWAVDAAPLAAKPGGPWSCRVTPLTDRPPALPSALSVRLDPIEAKPGNSRPTPQGSGSSLGDARPAPPSEVELAWRGRREYTGVLPKTPGLWQLTVKAGSPWAGQSLGLVLITEGTPQSSVSLYTYRNRAVFRRGDPVDLLWNAKRPAGAAATQWQVLLRGRGLEMPVGRIALSKGGGIAGGSLKLDTTALAPGVYEATVRAEGVAVYSVRFRVCQREPLSDYELYSYVFGQAKPHGGSPVTAYYAAAKLAEEPGLAPFLEDADASLAATLASYASDPAGPVLEKFTRPSPDEASFMALASLGMRAVPGIPSLLHHEEWNPKHTLPEELAALRRRLALFVQSQTDVSGFGGLALNWFATLNGYWEESPPLDGHQARRNAEAAKWIAARVEEQVTAAKGANIGGKELETVRSRAQLRSASSVLPNAYAEHLADARKIRPDLTAHSGIPDFWLGGGQSYPPCAYSSLTHRDSVDYTDYGIAPWGNFRAPAFLNMGNGQGQKLYCCFATWGRHNRIVTAFGAAGRGLDGISLALEKEHPQGEDEALLRIFERFGPYFSALEPLPDVAVYSNDWPQQKFVVLHDLARMRRPGMVLGPEDVLDGRLKAYRVLFLAGVAEGEPAEVLKTFRDFEAGGGVILKDETCHPSVPGRSLGFAYDKSQVHSGWGLAWPNGEWEFAHLWENFKKTREKPLIEAFATLPRIPVTTPDADVVISPLAGKESICCFVLNQTLVPLSVAGKWRQHAVLPRIGELRVEDGWHVRDLLTGRAAPTESTPQGRRVAVDLTRAEGAIYLLTRREPKTMAIETRRVAPHTLRLTAWLADAKDQSLLDPLPFEVVLKGPGGAVLFRKFAALGPQCPLDVPVPVLTGEQTSVAFRSAEGRDFRGAKGDNPRLELSVRDLVLGCIATQAVTPATEPALTAGAADFIGGTEPVAAFFRQRKGPVTVLLDEGQEAFRAPAEQLARLLRKGGREARVVTWDPAEVRPLPLRWKPTEEDQQIVESLRGGKAFAWRVALGAVQKQDTKGNRRIQFDDPACGYDEYGPRLRHDADIVLFGAPETHRVLADLQPWLRRVPSEDFPSANGFFVHYLWSALAGGYDGLYVGCRDADGATAAVARLAETVQNDSERSASPPPAGNPAITRGGAPAPLENMLAGKFGTRILDVAFAPGGKRLFVTADSYGDSLFALGPNGEIQEKRALGNRCGNSTWSRSGGRLRPVDETTVRVSLGSSEYQYSLERGWLSRAAIPPTGFKGRFTVPIAASTLLENGPQRRVYLGGAQRMRALDAGGRLLWTYHDAAVRTSTADLLYPRSLFPRGVTLDGRVLLVAGFGIEHDCYSRGKAANASVLGLDAASGKLLWQREGMLLNEGKVVPMDDRFLIVGDAGDVRVVRAATGEDAGRLPPVEGTDWILALPGREEVLIVENNAFDRQGPTARVYLRSLRGGPDQDFPVRGRISDVAVAPDGSSVTLATSWGQTVRFALDGRLLWQSETPSGGLVRLSPDGQTVLVGACDGVLHWLSATDGKRLRSLDFNPFNVTTADRFLAQAGSLGDVPADASLTLPPDPPEPSYRASFDPKKLAFGANLLSQERLLAASRPAAPAIGDPAKPAAVLRLSPEASFALRVEAGKTYLIELLAAAAEPEKLTSQTRLELAVQGQGKTAHLPYCGRLPVGRFLARRRAAFRADQSGEVTLKLRCVGPRDVGDAKKPRMTYEQTAPSAVGLLVAEVMVVAMDFGGRNLVFDGGPTAKSKPAGDLHCTVKPWSGGDSSVRTQPYSCPQTALRLVDGVIANQDTAWTKDVRGGAVDYAEAWVRLKGPQQVRSIVIYEDNSGPIAVDSGVSETVAPHYAVYVREARSKQWHRIGHVVDNANLVNVFACPSVDIDEVRYFWAGRNDADRTDGFVRMAELEAYSADDFADILEGPSGVDSILNRPGRREE
jgi:hypothetical protein